MDDLKKWLLLSQRCKDMLVQSFVFEDSIRLVLLLVEQLESEYTSMRTSNLRHLSEETFSTHLEVANQEEVS